MRLNEHSVFYKIRNHKTGLYNDGKSYEKWHAVGQSWASRKAVENYIKKCLKNSKNMEQFKDCEIVCLRTVVHNESSVDEVAEMIQGFLVTISAEFLAAQKVKIQAEQQFKAAKLEAQKAREIARLKKLNEKWGHLV